MGKTQLIDKAGNAGSFGLAIAFYAAFFILLIVGGSGPTQVVYEPAINSGPPTVCPTTNTSNIAYDNCVVPWSATVAAVPYNQDLWLTLQQQRPQDANGRWLLWSTALTFDLLYAMDVSYIDKGGAKVVMSTNVSHLARLTCPPMESATAPADKAWCGTSTIFMQSYLSSSSYTISFRAYDPLLPWTSQNLVPATGNVTFNVVAGKVNEKFTQFQLGAKYFFFSVSLIMFAVYTWALYAGPGARNPDTKAQLPTSEHQRWTWWLSLGLVFANDPLFAAHLLTPSIGVAGFFAFCSFSFLVTLLFYWLVMFDRARIETFKTLEITRSPKGCYQRCVTGLSRTASAMCFWVPKIMLMLLFWVLSMTLYMYQMYMQQFDPAYSVYEAFPPGISQYFDSFIKFIASIYIIWIIFLVFVACYGCKRVSLSGRFVMGVTMSAILFVVSGYLASDFFDATRQTSLVFMLQYGALNSYVWFLIIAFIPAYAPSAEDLAPSEAKDDFYSMGKSDTAEAEVQTDDLPLYAPGIPSNPNAPGMGGGGGPYLGHAGGVGGSSAKAVPVPLHHPGAGMPVEAQAAGGEYFSPEGGMDAADKVPGWR